MPRILLAYEFGSGLGHLNRLVAVARRLGEGNEFVFALPDLKLAEPVLAQAFGTAATLRAGVVWPAPSDPAARLVPTLTFADVVQLFGYGEGARLLGATQRWRAILDETRPDLIVADFAPTLRLAVGDAIPSVVVGNGYTVPPPGRPLPPMRSRETIVPPASRAAEGTLMAAVNRVRGRIGGAAVDHFADLFSGTETFVCTIPEFDPYAAWRTGPTTWPFNIPTISPGPPAAQRSGPAIFVYLPASHPLLDATLAALDALGHKAWIYVAGTDPRTLAAHCKRHIGFLTKPADFAQVLPQVRLLIHHAGLGTAYAGLAAGTPQLVLPLNLEHLITSRGLLAAGVAQGFGGSEGPDEAALRARITDLLVEPTWMDKAAVAAARLAKARDADPLGAVLAACERLLRSLGEVRAGSPRSA